MEVRPDKMTSFLLVLVVIGVMDMVSVAKEVVVDGGTISPGEQILFLVSVTGASLSSL